MFFRGRSRCPSVIATNQEGTVFCLNSLPQRHPPPPAYSVILFDVVSASWRGGDRRPAGAEAPTPPGRSSRVSAGQRGGRRPYDARQGGEQGTHEGRRSLVKDGCPKAGLGVVGGKGPPRPLIPCPPTGSDPAWMPGRNRCPAAKIKKLKCTLPSAEPHLRTLGRSFSLAVSAVRQSLQRIRKGLFFVSTRCRSDTLRPSPIPSFCLLS